MSYGSSTVDRAIDVLTAITSSAYGLTNAEVCEQLGVDRSASHRLLATLERRGLIQRADGRRFTAGPFLAVLAAGSAPDLRTVAEPIFAELVELTGESASLSVLLDETFMCVGHRLSPHELSYCPTTTTRYPLHSGAAGLTLWAFQPATTRDRLLDSVELTAFTDKTVTDRDVLRAELDATVERRYGRSAGVRTPGGVSVAAPVYGRQGDVTAALALSAAEIRLPLAKLEEFVPDLRAAAGSMSRALGWRP